MIKTHFLNTVHFQRFSFFFFFPVFDLHQNVNNPERLKTRAVREKGDVIKQTVDLASV